MSVHMNFALSDEQVELRRTVRAFLEQKSPEAEVRRLMETDAGYDPAVWQQMATQLGLQGLAIPEEFGGSGFSMLELGIVLEEMGRVLLCAPFFSTAVLATTALLACGDDAARKALLPAIAAGETIATLAVLEEHGDWSEQSVTTTATPRGDGWTLDGVKSYVIDGLDHTVHASPDCTRFVDVSSYLDHPAVSRLRDADGAEISVLTSIDNAGFAIGAAAFVSSL